jgi:predicted RNA methylase
MSHDGLERLSREIHRIIGTKLSDEQLKGLLGLKPLSTQSLNRFFQIKTRVQLKKGQSGHIVQALDRARGRPATALPSTPSRLCAVDPDLAALATLKGRELAKVLREILHDVHFDQVNRDLRLPRYGGDYEIRPFPLPASPVDKHEMKVRLRDAVKASRSSDDATLARRIQQAFSFFMFGESLTGKALEELFGEARKAAIDEAFTLGLFVNTEGQAVRMNELSLFSMKLRNGDVVHVFADTPPHFETRAAHQRVYVGADSYELMERVSALDHVSGYCVEMGSGSGIQLIAALKQYPAITRAIGKERDRRAMHVSLFNAALNGVEDKLVVVNDDDGLRRALDEHPISFAMTNPPFIAMPAWIDIDVEDRPSLSGLMDIRETEHGCQGDLRTAFPGAGWGGEDGLEVTKEFVDALFPLLAADSQTVIYSQFAGETQGPGVFRDYIQARGGFHFAFEPVRSRTLVVKQPETDRIAEGQNQKVFSAGEIASSVARLIVAALMARQEPRHLRVNVRKGGPEHLLLMKFARRIEESYRRQGITHFHDGFAVLTTLRTL